MATVAGVTEEICNRLAGEYIHIAGLWMRPGDTF